MSGWNFPPKLAVSCERFMQEIIGGTLFGYIQSNFDVLDHLFCHILHFRSFIKNIVVKEEGVGT